jgi:hypothetical protein
MSGQPLVRSVSRRLRRRAAPALLAGALGLGGCVYAGVGVGVAVPLGPPVVVAHGHVHSAACGHTRYRGRWYHAARHRHGPHCGHVLRGGVWVLIR